MNKNLLIDQLLVIDIDMPTKKIIYAIKKIHKVDVSQRHVQRVRKSKRDISYLTERNNKMSKDDAFDTKEFSDFQIDVLNHANEGNWTVQEIAVELNATVYEVRQVLEDYHFMVHGPVLDSEKEDVYTDSSKSDETEDVFDTSTEENEEVETAEEETEEVEVEAEEETIVDNSGVFMNNTNQPVDDVWEVKIDCVTACSKVQSEVNVFMNRTSRLKAMKFMQWAGAREWLAYLVGEQKEDGDYNIIDLYLPDQRTSATLVDNVTADEYNDMSIVGVIHSHHEMGAGDENNPSFSAHDDAFINGNHNLSLLAGRDRKTKGFKIVGIGRVKTPCGGLMKVKACVKQMKESLSEEEEALKKEFLGKTQTQVRQSVQVSNAGFLGGPSRVTHNADGSKTYHYGGGGGYPANQVGFQGHQRNMRGRG